MSRIFAVLVGSLAVCAAAPAQQPPASPPAAGPASAWLERARAEPNPDRRSELALNAAEASLQASRKAYRDADVKSFEAMLDEVRDAVQLARDALRPKHRSQKYLKRAEQRTRLLVRKLDDFDKEAAIDDRPRIETVLQFAQAAHDEFLDGVMRKR